MNTPTEKRWLIPPPLPPQAAEALRAFPPVLRQLLYNRGYSDDASARTYLKASYEENTDPFTLLGIAQATDRIAHAIANRERIVIYGDYDVDGVTATALLTETLRALDADVHPYIPNRFEEGYGLNHQALTDLQQKGAKLVISVDCGIRSVEEAEHAHRLGLDLIITDHHHPGPTLPPALAIINPKQPADPYPEKYLAGVGIAWKLAAALKTRFPQAPFSPQSLLDLVALGTVADLAPLTGENRQLVRRGLRQMMQTTRQGLYSLAQAAGINLKKITATHIGFMLGPRLNAAGRIDQALAAYELLTTQNFMEAGRLAQKLDVQNRIRQKLTAEVQEAAEKLALPSDDQLPPLLFAVHPDFNQGVVGLAASRLVEKYHRPAIVGRQEAEVSICSCRSIPQFHITEALDACAHLLVRHGGHAAAAGFTVANTNLEALQHCLMQQATTRLAQADLRPTLRADMEIPLAWLTPELHQHLRYLEPTGYGNPGAVFVTRGLRVAYARPVGHEQQHLKLKLTDGHLTFDAIAFRQGQWYKHLPQFIDVLYTFETNEWNGRLTFQLNLRDLRPAQS